MKKIVTLFLMLGAVLSMNAKSINPEFKKDAAKHEFTSMMQVKNVNAASALDQKAFPYTKEEAQKMWEAAQVKKNEIGMPQAPGRFFTMDDVTAFEIDGASFEYEAGEFWGYSYYSYSIYGMSDEAILAASIDFSFDDIEKTGTFELADFDTVMFYLVDGSDTVSVAIQDFSITITEEEDGSMIGVANITDSEGQVYEVTLRYIIPDPIDSVDVYFEEPAMSMYYSDYGYWIYAESEDYWVQYLIDGESGEGVFDQDDMDASYTILAKIEGTDTTMIDYYNLSLTGVKNAAEDSIILSGEYFGKDSILYFIHAAYKLPKLTGDTINVVIADADIEDSYFDYYGLMAVYGQPSDLSQYALLYMYLDESLVGTYSEEDLYSGYAYFGVFNAGDTVWYDIQEADFTISSSGTDTYSLSGSFICYPEDDPSSLVVFNASIDFEYSGGGSSSGDYDYDGTSNVSKTYNASSDSVSWDSSYMSSYGVVYLEAYAQDGSDYVILEFNSSVATIPAGTYDIAESGSGIYVSASSGYDSSYGYIYPSYYATLDGDYISTPWYMLSGTVTISASQIVIAAVNSNSKVISITINLAGSAIEEVAAEKVEKGEKMIENGVLKIKHDGKIYNAIGAELK